MTQMIERPTTAEAMLERVADLVPRIRERSAEAERNRRIPEETITDLLDAGVLHVNVPKEFGGLGLGLREHFEAVRLIARGCVSTAWVASFLAQTASWAMRFPLKAQREVFDSPNYRGLAGTNQARPGSKAVPVEGGYRLTGRWGFGSGIMHCEWCVVSVFVEGTAATDNGSSRAPDPTRLFCLVPVRDITIDDVWHTSGMRATASNDVVADNVFVPAERTLTGAVFVSPDSPGAAAHPDYDIVKYPIYRLASVLHPAYTLGAAERALEIFRDEIAPTRKRPWNSGALKDLPVIHMRYAEAVHKTQIARLLAYENLDGVESGLGEGYPLELRAHLTLGATGSIVAAGEAVSILTRNSGGSIHFVGKELDRIQRDMEVLLNHSTGDLDFAAEASGRVLLGLGLGGRPNEFF